LPKDVLVEIDCIAVVAMPAGEAIAPWV
jgi:hypothetical protein